MVAAIDVISWFTIMYYCVPTHNWMCVICTKLLPPVLDLAFLTEILSTCMLNEFFWYVLRCQLHALYHVSSQLLHIVCTFHAVCVCKELWLDETWNTNREKLGFQTWSASCVYILEVLLSIQAAEAEHPKQCRKESFSRIFVIWN